MAHESQRAPEDVGQAKRLRNSGGAMSFREHLYDLRHRVALALLVIVIGAVFGFLWFQWRIGPVPSLSSLLLGPYCELPSSVRLEPVPGKCQLLQTQPFEAFLIQFKVGVAAGAVLTAPLWLYQLWAFVTPALHSRERRLTLSFAGFGSVLFAAGAVLAYLLVPVGLSMLVSFGGDSFITALAGDKYISFVLVMLVIFGVSFELPLLVTMLNRIGILPYHNLKRWRRGLFFGLFVFAAIATPGTDPVSMLALASAMAVLLELAIQLARLHDKHKAKRELAAELVA